MLGYITDTGSPDGLVRRSFPEPQPLPHEAIVSVDTFSVSRGELTLLKLRPDGFRPGQEVAGTVAVAAADGSGPPVGSRVAGLCHGGSWAERVAVPGSALGQVPADLDMAQAVALAGSGLMAFRALHSFGELAGKRILITGAAGSVGSPAVQLALLGGAKVTALVSAPDRRGNLPDRPDLKVVSELSDDCGPFDAALDGVGGPVLPATIRRLASGGLALAYGQLGGEPSLLSPSDFRGAPNSRLGAFFLWLTDNATFGADIGRLCAMAEGGEICAPIAVERDWADLPQVVAAMRGGNTLGKAVLTVASGR